MRLLVLECKTVLEDEMLPLSARGAENLVQAPVARKVDNTIHRINLYLVDNAVGLLNT